MRLPELIAQLVRPVLWAGLVACCFVPAQSQAQWRLLAQPSDPGGYIAGTLYFLNLPGPPRVGFVVGTDTFPNFRVNGYRETIYKTIDGGQTWHTIPLGNADVGAQFIFKDSEVGWLSMRGGAIYMTIDQGETWSALPGIEMDGSGLYYDSLSDGLFAATWGVAGLTQDLIVSWDEGLTWAPISNSNWVYNGFAFNEDVDGVVSMGYAFGTPWLRTTDAGKNWRPISMDSECWQPLAIAGTKTQFAITDVWGNILRTDNLWDSSWVVYSFPFAPGARGFTTGAIQGDSSHLFVQLNTGVYLSTDQGKSWKYLCGEPYDTVPDTPNFVDYIYDHRFYVRYPYVCILTHNGPNRGGALWMLNVDSMQFFPTAITFPDGSKRMSIAAGNDITINYSPQTSDGIGIDTGHLVFHFDTSSLTLTDIKFPSSWVILDSSSANGTIILAFTADSNTAIYNPLVSLTFKSYLSPTSGTTTRVFLDSTYLSGHRLNCECQALSTGAPDSVEIDFTGCGDSTLVAAMEGQPPFSIERIVPNPAGASVRVEGTGQGVEAQLLDDLGREVLPLTLHPLPFTLDVSGLPPGIYFLRLSSSGYAVSRSIAISR